MILDLVPRVDPLLKNDHTSKTYGFINRDEVDSESLQPDPGSNTRIQVVPLKVEKDQLIGPLCEVVQASLPWGMS